MTDVDPGLRRDDKQQLIMSFNHITILGLGLIGSSLARALHETQAASHITGFDSNPDAMAYGLNEGYLANTTQTPEDAVKGADLIILAAPISTLSALMRAIAPHIKPGAIVSDISSVKSLIVKDIAPHTPAHAHFVPAHPIAGKATSGHREASATLFAQRRCVLTPCAQSDEASIRKMIGFWEQLGARVEIMEADDHDMIYAYMSHLPQLLAYTVSETLGSHKLTYPLPESFLPFIRLGGSNPALWTEIFLANHEALIEALDIFLHVADHIREELVAGRNDQHPSQRSPDAPTLLFPRVIASCLVTAVTVFERHGETSLARYAGPGFADFASPALSEPENDIEKISQHYEQIVELLQSVLGRCRELRELILLGQSDTLRKALGEMQQAHAQLMEPRN